MADTTRKTEWAALLSLPAPFIVFLLAWLVVHFPVPRAGIALGAALVFVFAGLVFVAALRGARRTAGTPPPWYGRRPVHIAAYALGGAAGLAGFALFAGGTLRAFKIPSGGMEPALLMGDHLLADNTPFTPRRGDIVTFLFPEDHSRVFVKRVIGLPGETVEVRGRAVLINGTALSEPYAHFMDSNDEEDAAAPGTRAWGPETMQPGQFFVLGDNRDNSRDSRFWGFVPKDLVLGRPALIYFSREMSRDDPPLQPTAIRWGRIGRRIQ